MKAAKIIFFLGLVFFTACDSGTVEPVDAGNDPNFTIVANEDDILKKYNRKVVVFGIDIYAVPDVTDLNLLYTANVMAQYLDNDEDGTPDNQTVIDEMIENKAFMVLWEKQRDIPTFFPSDRTGQDLGNDETNPAYVEGGKTGRFDAGLEEVLHIITHAGYSQVYPNVFGESQGSKIADAMDIARDGQFTSIPSSYSANAWYTYDDRTCDYECQVTEYFYWALTSVLGAQENRLDEIEQEWKLNTKEKVELTDLPVYQLLTDSLYHLPTILPDGTYMR
jgi:hypothetical protein